LFVVMVTATPTMLRTSAMQYALLINEKPGYNDGYTDEQRQAVTSDYMAVDKDPGVTGGAVLKPPATATTVRVQDGETLVTDGPFADTKEVLGGWFLVEAADLDAAIEIAARVPAARLGGSVEIRPLVALHARSDSGRAGAAPEQADGMPNARELLHSNLHEVFSERDPGRRRAAIERTYTEDVTFIYPEGEFVGHQAVNDQAQKLLDGPLAGFVFEEDGPRYVGTDTAVLAWRAGPPGKPVARGINILTIRDGRVSVLRTLIAS
jgi:hypothetical protein